MEAILPNPKIRDAHDLSFCAHDLRNQLMVVVGFCDMVSLALRQPGESARERAAHMISRIRAAAEQSTGIVSQMMGRDGAVAPLDLHAFLVDEVGTLGLRLLREEINVALERGARMPPVRVDPLGLQRAVGNLAANAREAILSQPDRCGSGMIRFSTNLPPLAVGRPCVMLAVGDNGPGMDEATLARIWEPGWSSKENGAGLRGYGLAGVRAFVEGSGGSVEAYSEPGRGTTFTLFLPTA